MAIEEQAPWVRSLDADPTAALSSAEGSTNDPVPLHQSRPSLNPRACAGRIPGASEPEDELS